MERIPSTGWLVWQVAVRMRASLDRALEPHGLTSTHYGVLASLQGLSQGGRPPSQRQLADFAGLEPMHVSKVVRALEQAGLLERANHPGDTRAVQLTLTPRGAEALAAGRRAVLDLEREHLSPLDADQAGQLHAHLLTLLRHLDGKATP
ncbi:MarR family transcriptional regulator [Nonomuraea sp. NN258]|uniref:MarR family winged helix-turn-helix transcriptional regulator n=1 Tax=Nonomuraea antri TaxID=2730852 RepID=UPI0015687E15|nr:MarR family transcriptional regulator [Nonomuraea antri]NRQ32202.1 MarR family transcriptional regulator [Nonomuraea antri]